VGQSRGLADIFNDSLSISVVNSSYNGNLSYGFGSKSKRQSLALNLALQSTTDYSQYSSALSGNASFMSSVNYSMNIPAHKINGSGALSYVKMNTGGRKMINIGPSFSATKTWKNGLYRTSLNHNSQARQTNGLNDGLMSNTGLNLGTTLKKQTLAIGLNYLYNQYKTQSDGLNFRNFSEYRGSVTYGVRF
jgi:hypothetical protein